MQEQMSFKQKLLLVVAAVIGAWAFGVLALNNGEEKISATWLVVAAACIYIIGYGFYGRFVAMKVMGLDERRATPAYTLNDGKDYHPTGKYVLFGHHFAAIAGAGPLVGPVLAAQMGYLPGMLWLLVGVVLAGAVHDFVVMIISVRHNGKSLGEMIKLEMGKFTGGVAMVGIFFIMLILIAILAMVVVKALADSPWGLFTITMTIPIALAMGVWTRYIRPGKVLEASIVGFIALLVSIWAGHYVVASPFWNNFFSLSGEALAWAIMIYGFCAAVLPVWLLLAPRDYLSTFLKLGVIFLMGVIILIVGPEIKMPAVTIFASTGDGPVFAGDLFPFLFVTIACGAISGFHALISSGTSPKMVQKETQTLFIGYGAMLMESLVGVMALVCAVMLSPGEYFSINMGGLGTDIAAAVPKIQVVLDSINANGYNFTITASELEALAKGVGEETMLSRTGGAPTFALGLALLFHEVLGGAAMMPYWYHFAILFEALFILTAVDAGTRTCRFMIQDILGNIYQKAGDTTNMTWAIIATLIGVAGWGYLLYAGVTDPMGGIYTLWALFGASNQMLAGMALLFATVYIFKIGKAKYSFVTIIPLVWVWITTMYAALCKILPSNGDPTSVHDKVSHVATVQNKSAELLEMTDMALIEKTKIIIFNNTVDAVLCVIFMIVVLIVTFQGIKICIAYARNKGKEDYPLKESKYIDISEVEDKKTKNEYAYV